MLSLAPLSIVGRCALRHLILVLIAVLGLLPFGICGQGLHQFHAEC